LVSDSITAVIGAARAGMGVATLPCFLGDPDPALVDVPHGLNGLTLELWVLTHPALRHTARVRALMAHLHHALGEHRDLIEGKAAAGPN
jgi:DNA-binding transcriptional LysR family regulator